LAHPQRLGRLSATGQANGVNRTLPPELQEHNAVPQYRADDDLSVERTFSFTVFPELTMRRGVKRGKAVLARHEKISLTIMFDQQRRGVSRPDRAIFLPGNFACALVQADQV